MAVAGMSPQLQCVACPSQNIICQCVVAGDAIVWRLDLELIVAVAHNGEIVYNANCYVVTGEELENGLSSNLSLIAGPVTVECEDTQGLSNWSYSIVGTFLEIFIFLMCQYIKHAGFFLATQSHQVHQ